MTFALLLFLTDSSAYNDSPATWFIGTEPAYFLKTYNHIGIHLYYFFLMKKLVTPTGNDDKPTLLLKYVKISDTIFQLYTSCSPFCCVRL